MIWTSQEIYLLEPEADISAGSLPDAMIIYRLSDTVVDGAAIRCALEDPAMALEMGRQTHLHDVLRNYDTLMSDLQAMTARSLKEVDLAVTTDFEYFSLFGAQTALRIQSIINAVSGIYTEQLGVTLRIATTVINDTASDPFSDTTDPVTLVYELSAYYSSNTGLGGLFYGMDLLHLFTGRTLVGAAGIAFLGVVCNPSFGVGLSRDLSDSIARTILTAHEIGHNFNADHDGEAGSPCETTPLGGIMSSGIGNVILPPEFSQCSTDFIIPHRDAAICLATLSSSAGVKLGAFRPGANAWFLDNGNGAWDNCSIDQCLGPFGAPTDLPVAGDWDGISMDKVGTFRPSTGQWFLDDGNGAWDNCSIDQCLGPFGSPGDLPVVGNWDDDAAGTDEIGAFRPSTGQWFLDNGNGVWDNCSIDQCLGPFGSPGDLPVVGLW